MKIVRIKLCVDNWIRGFICHDTKLTMWQEAFYRFELKGLTEKIELG